MNQRPDIVLPRAEAPARVSESWFGALLRGLIGVLLCLTPVTGVLVLGWLMRVMAREGAVSLLGQGGQVARGDVLAGLLASQQFKPLARPPGWFRLDEGSLIRRSLGGLWLNLTLGLKALIAAAACVLPFGLLWLLGWWAGWDNSFNKGYEQAWVGPTVGFSGVAIALFTLSYLPIALAHMALEGRMAAFFEIRRVLSLIACAGWRMWLLALATALAALPLFAYRGMPVFMEGIYPEIAQLEPDALKEFTGRYRLLGALWLFAALVWLRKRAARIYAFACRRALADDPVLMAASQAREVLRAAGALPKPSKKPRHRGPLRALVWMVAMAPLWFGLVAQIFVGQFLNHAWALWLSHPFYALPWLP